MQYQGAPMSAILRTFNISQIEGAEDDNIWGYFPLWPGGSRDPLPHTRETTRQLKEEGYEECTNPALKPMLSTICYDVRVTQEENGTLHDWARGVTPIGDAPVLLLCHSISNCPPENIRFIPILNPLPMPQIGEKALVFNEGTRKFHLYTIEQLPETARQLREQVKEKITALSSPVKWPAFTEHHQVASDKAKCRQMLDTLYTRKMLVAGDPKLYEQTDMLEKALLAAQTQIRDLKRLLSKPNFRTEWEELQAMVYQLAKEYSAYHHTQVQPPAPALKQKRQAEDAPPVINPFMNGHGAMPSSLLPLAIIESVQNAASGANRWQQQKAQPPSYSFLREPEKGKEWEVNYFQAIIQYGQQEDIVPAEDTAAIALWNEVKSMTDLDTDALAYSFALFVKMSGGSAWFNISDFLDSRGVKPKTTRDEHGKLRRAGHQNEERQNAMRALFRISRLWIKIEERRIPAKRKGKKDRVYVHRGKIFTIDQFWTQEGYADDLSTLEIPIALHLIPGEWLREYLEAPRMVAYLAEHILKYHPIREMWEKRLAFYYMFHARINAKHWSNTIRRRVGLLFHDLSLPIDKTNPQRTRDRFEKAMNQLVEDKQIDAWDYKEQTKLPSRNWFDQWQEWQVMVHTRAQLKEVSDAAPGR